MENKINNIYPSFLNVEYNVLEVDGRYTVGVIVTDYSSKVGFIEIIEAIPKNLESRYSIYVFKQNEMKILKELTTVIASATSERKLSNKNQLDVDVLDKISDKARELRRRIQLENEEVYRVCIYISVWDSTKERVLEKARVVQNTLYAKGVITKVGNFRQKEIYQANLPLNMLDRHLKNNTYTTFTTTTLSYLFPYYNRYIMEKGGVQFGIINKNICIIDMFSKKSTNANMLVVGSSGSGKSYFAHILVIRGAINGILQRVIDPEGEYVYLSNILGGQVIEENINLMYFPESYIKNNRKDYIEKKISSLMNILNAKETFTEEEQDILERSMRTSYKIKNITEDEETLYKTKDDKGLFVSKEYIGKLNFPNFEDVLKTISNLAIRNIITKKLKKLLSLKTIATREIIEKSNIVVYNLKNIPEDKKETYIQIYFESIKAEYGTKLQIYIDELWKCIGYGKNQRVMFEVTDMFKSIRKHNAGIIAITQDISDLFKYEKGAFAKSILNNSYIKAYFKMEYVDIENLEKMGVSDKKELDKIKMLEKGTAIVTRGWTTFYLDVIADENEKKYIESGGVIGEEHFGSNG